MTTKIYPFLKPYFYASLVNAVIHLIPTKQGSLLYVLTLLISLVASVIVLYELYRLSPAADRLRSSFRYNIAVLVLTGVLLAIALLMFANQENLSALGSMMLLFLPVMILLAIFVLLAEYQFFWGLDDLIEPNGYDYPVGRIKWCFYAALIGGVFGSLIGSFITTIVNIMQFYLLYEYLQAVRAREEQPLL